MYGPEHKFCSRCGRALIIKDYEFFERRACPKYGSGVFTLDFNHDTFVVLREHPLQTAYDIVTGKKL